MLNFRRINNCLQFLLYFLLFNLFCVSAYSQKPKPVFRFAILGDVHYMIPDYCTADYLVPLVAKELDSLKLKPEFIIQTGDLFTGSKGVDIETEAAFAFKNFEKNFDIPFFIAKGNHDAKTYYEKNALPIFSRELRNTVLKSYYSFNKSNCHFIILDCTDEKLANQLSWLEKDLAIAKSNNKIEHIFVSGHYPLWIVARAGFTRSEYSTKVASLLARYKVDAYFCGHTHNKTVTVRLIDGQPLTQIMDAGVVEEGRLFSLAPFLRHIKTEPKDITRPGILPLEEGHQIFIPKSELEYYWGYQEGSTTSYYIITVEGKNVQADWHILGQGITRSFKWDQPGKLVDIKRPVNVETKPLIENDFKLIEKAWFYAAPWTDEDSIIAPLSINGVPAGALAMNKVKMAGSPFWNKIEVQLNRSVIDVIKMQNEINISNPAKGRFGMAHMFLLVQFRDGHFAKSSISQKVITSFYPEEKQTNFPAAEFIDSVKIGNPLSKIILRFDKFYK